MINCSLKSSREMIKRECRGHKYNSLLPASSVVASIPSSSTSHQQNFSTSAIVLGKPRRNRQVNDPLALRAMGKFEYDDIPALGHQILNRKREMLKYARIVQHEMPKLATFKKQYQPPSKESILRFRSHHYQGQAHPSTRKSVVTVNLKDLYNSGRLDSSKAARKKLLLLAGVRWDPMGEEVFTEDPDEMERIALEEGIGRIKITCEKYPEERMNLKWCSDAIDKLIEEANMKPEEIQGVPLDLRGFMIREAKRSGFDRRKAASLQDFPEAWLPLQARE